MRWIASIGHVVVTGGHVDEAEDEELDPFDQLPGRCEGLSDNRLQAGSREQFVHWRARVGDSIRVPDQNIPLLVLNPADAVIRVREHPHGGAGGFDNGFDSGAIFDIQGLVAGIDSDFCILAEGFRRFIFVDLSWDTTTLPMLRLPIPVYYVSMKAFLSFPLPRPPESHPLLPTACRLGACSRL